MYQAERKIDYEACLKLHHPIVEYPNGIWFCKICHQRDDDAFAHNAKSLLERVKEQAGLVAVKAMPLVAGAGLMGASLFGKLSRDPFVQVGENVMVEWIVQANRDMDHAYLGSCGYVPAGDFIDHGLPGISDTQKARLHAWAEAEDIWRPHDADAGYWWPGWACAAMRDWPGMCPHSYQYEHLAMNSPYFQYERHRIAIESTHRGESL